MISKLHYWLKSYCNFAEWVDFSFWLNCIWKGLHRACKAGLFLFCVYQFSIFFDWTTYFSYLQESIFESWLALQNTTQFPFRGQKMDPNWFGGFLLNPHMYGCRLFYIYGCRLLVRKKYYMWASGNWPLSCLGLFSFSWILKLLFFSLILPEEMWTF